jgi:hypothetical protein
LEEICLNQPNTFSVDTSRVLPNGEDSATAYTGYTWRIFRSSFVDTVTCPSNYNCTLLPGSGSGGLFYVVEGSPIITVDFKDNSTVQGSDITVNLELESGICKFTTPQGFSGEGVTGCASSRVSEESTLKELRVFPNPSKNIFNYELKTAQAQQVELQVLDMMGRTVQHQTVDANGLATGEINLSQESNGIYMLRIRTKEGVEVRRLVKQ